MKPEFWRGKRVFLSGHTGFKGGWLSLWLQKLGADVTGYALAPSTNPSLYEVASVSASMNSIIGDIRNSELLTQAMRKANPEIVIHMAAQPLVRYSYKSPVETYETNVMGTVNLFESVRQCSSVKVVVNVTTDKCYENQEWNWGYRENDPLGGNDPYSSSKSCSEFVTAAYRESFFKNMGIHVASARAGNVIGGGDWSPDRLIPDILRSFEVGLPVEIRSPHSIRPWQHVLEPLSGYLTLSELLYEFGSEYAQSWNFGPQDDDARQVEWIVEKLAKKWGSNALWTMQNGEHPHESIFLKLDISKSKKLLNWSPRWSLGQSLQKIVEWHKYWLGGHNMTEITMAQISDFEKSIL